VVHRPRLPRRDRRELERPRATDTVWVIDARVVYQDPGGEIISTHLSDLSDDEVIELGATVGVLIGLGFEG
jgi:hypothetical protein